MDEWWVQSRYFGSNSMYYFTVLKDFSIKGKITDGGSGRRLNCCPTPSASPSPSLSLFAHQRYLDQTSAIPAAPPPNLSPLANDTIHEWQAIWARGVQYPPLPIYIIHSPNIGHNRGVVVGALWMKNPQRTGMTNMPCFHVSELESTHLIRLFCYISESAASFRGWRCCLFDRRLVERRTWR